MKFSMQKLYPPVPRRHWLRVFADRPGCDIRPLHMQRFVTKKTTQQNLSARQPPALRETKREG